METAAAEVVSAMGVETTQPAAAPVIPAMTRAARPPARLRPRGGFGGYLHELRRERGLSARQVAAAAGVHHTYVSKLERGDRQAPEEPVVEALAAALGATPAQLDQLRWRAGLSPRGAGAPAQDDPTLTLVAEALGNPALSEPARDQLRRAIAQAVQGPVGAPMPSPTPGAWPGIGVPGGVGVPGSFGTASGFGTAAVSGAAGHAAAPGPGPFAPAMAAGTIPAGTIPAGTASPMAPVLSPEAPPDPRASMLAGLLGGWQTVDEAAAELRVTSAYLLSLVQGGQLRAWALPGGAPGSLAGVRLRRDDVLALLQPVRL